MIYAMEYQHLVRVAMNMRERDRQNVFLTRYEENLGDYVSSVWTTPGIRLACIEDGDVWVVGGVTIDGPGRGTQWMICRDGWERYAKQVMRMNRQIQERTDLNRIQADIMESDPVAIRFIERLGFEFEGVKRGYCKDGQNLLLYSWIKGK